MQAQTPAPAPAMLPRDWQAANDDSADAWIPDWLSSPSEARHPAQGVRAPTAYLPADWND